jgi:nucleoid-associated protein YgaU
MINVSLNIPAAQNAAVNAVTGPAPGTPADTVLPKYYTVGTWPPDCFWEIARLVYGDPHHWPILYEANRSKLENPKNPGSLKPGTVLEIPSINGEYREGYYSR